MTAQEPAGGWTALAERGSVFGIQILVLLSTALGRGPARFVLRFVALYYVIVHAAVRKASREYLQRVHGPVSWRMIYRHVLSFAEVTLDRVFIARGKTASFAITRTGQEHLEELAKSGRGAILLGAHLGSFEAMRLQAQKEHLRINILGHFRNARMINAALKKLNPQSYANVISVDDRSLAFVFRIKERLERGEMIAILGDRVVRGERMAYVEFLGATAAVPLGPYLLAATLHCPLYLTFGLYRPPNGYDLFCEPFEQEVKLPRSHRDEALHEYAQKYATRLEHFVRLAPDNWFNFFNFWAAP